MKHFRQRLLDNEILVGTMVSLDSPEVVEILGLAGFDWLFIDAEHTPLEPGSLQRLLQAAGSVPCLVRVPSGDEVWIKKALDAGATGIIVPQVNSAEQARRVVNWCRYPPQGSRGVGLARAQGYGFSFESYVQSANEHITVIAQIENIRGVENIDDICGVDGIDALFIGPYDLSASLGKLGQLTDTLVLDAIDQVTAAGRKAGIRLGIAGFDADFLKPYQSQGYTLLVAGADTLFLRHSACELLNAVRLPGDE